MQRIKERWVFLVVIFLVFALDKVSKGIIESVFSTDRFRSIPVIDGFLHLIYTENRGAIWGIFQRHSQIITVVSVAALVIIFIYFFRIPRRCRLELWAFAFLCGGALGNIADRLLQGYVVDFIDMQFGKFHWATYNVADSAITVGVTLMIISLVFNRCPPPEKKDKEESHAPNTL